MNLARADQLVESGARRLQELARDLAGRGGFAEALAPELADDAEFLRRLKPSLIAARIRGDGGGNGSGPAPAPPPRPKAPKEPGAGPNPLLVVGGALVLGIVLAKLVDWRGHAHPRVD